MGHAVGALHRSVWEWLRSEWAVSRDPSGLRSEWAEFSEWALVRTEWALFRLVAILVSFDLRLSGLRSEGAAIHMCAVIRMAV